MPFVLHLDAEVAIDRFGAGAVVVAFRPTPGEGNDTGAPAAAARVGAKGFAFYGEPPSGSSVPSDFDDIVEGLPDTLVHRFAAMACKSNYKSNGMMTARSDLAPGDMGALNAAWGVSFVGDRAPPRGIGAIDAIDRRFIGFQLGAASTELPAPTPEDTRNYIETTVAGLSAAAGGADTESIMAYLDVIESM